MAAIMSNQWGYSVPFEETDGKARPRAKRQNTHGSQLSDYRSTKTVTPRTSDLGAGIQSDSEEIRQRRRSLKAGNSGARRKRSRNSPRGQAEDDRYGDDERVDDSAWIHRDKLAQIEIQEMVEAGIPLRQSRRSASAGPGASARSSRSMSRSRKSTGGGDQQKAAPPADERYSTNSYGYDEYGRKRVSTIDQAAEEDEHMFEASDVNVQPLSPRERQRDSVSPTSAQRPGTSRIPVSTSPSVPVPQNVVGRETPLPRSRHGSGAMSGNWEELQYARRARTNSVGSQVLLDDDALNTPPRVRSSYKTSSNENSPPKMRTPNKAAPTSASTRKSSGTAARPGSSAGRKTATQRSTSRTDNRSRPSASSQYPPEGDPPWISNMYKPDPRLPQDQQMLPTHARRLAQEQWEKEGKTGTVYDRDLRLLNDKEFPPPPPAPVTSSPKNTPSPDTTTAPPLTLDVRNFNDLAKTQPGQATTLSPRSTTGSNRSPDRLEPGHPSRSGTPAGGYRITPTIAPIPPIQRSSTAYSQQANTIRAPTIATEKDAIPEAKNSRSCGCCVMM